MNVYKRLNLFLKIARVARNFSSNKRKIPNYYEVLGVNHNATQLDIKNSYFEKTKLCHPDVVEPNDDNLAKFRQISEAYEVLGSPALRKDYDENVLGVIEDDTSHEDPIREYREQMSRRTTESNDWIRNYTNEMRINEYVSKHVKKSVNDITYVAPEKFPETKFAKFSEHRLTKFLAGTFLILVLMGMSISETFQDFLLDD